jgi:hypothetical protein
VPFPSRHIQVSVNEDKGNVAVRQLDFLKLKRNRSCRCADVLQFSYFETEEVRLVMECTEEHDAVEEAGIAKKGNE